MNSPSSSWTCFAVLILVLSPITSERDVHFWPSFNILKTSALPIGLSNSLLANWLIVPCVHSGLRTWISQILFFSVWVNWTRIFFLIIGTGADPNISLTDAVWACEKNIPLPWKGSYPMFRCGEYAPEEDQNLRLKQLFPPNSLWRQHIIWRHNSLQAQVIGTKWIFGVPVTWCACNKCAYNEDILAGESWYTRFCCL